MTSESDDVIKRVRSNQCRPKQTDKRERRVIVVGFVTRNAKCEALTAAFT